MQQQREGPRRKKLRQALDKAVQLSINLTFENFAACFPFLDLKDPSQYELLTKLHREFLLSLRSSIESEFEEINKEVRVGDKLDAIDSLVAQQQALGLEFACLPLPNMPERIARTERCHAKQEEIERLRSEVQQMEQSNEELMNDLHSRRMARDAYVATVNKYFTQLTDVSHHSAQWEGSSSRDWLKTG